MKIEAQEVAKRVKQYLDIRARLKAMDAEHEKRKGPLVEIQNLLSGWILRVLDETGQKNLAVEGVGTAYRSTRTTAALDDADVFMKYVINNQAFDLLDRRANAKAVEDRIKATGEPIPGVHLNTMVTVGAQKSPNSAAA